RYFHVTGVQTCALPIAGDVVQRRADDGVGAAGGAGGADQAVGAIALEARHAEAHAEVAREVLADGDDARLDLHLAHRDVQLRDQVTDRGDAVRGVLDQQRVDARVHRDVAAGGQQRTAGRTTGTGGLRADQRGDVLRLGEVHLHHFGPQRREFLHFLTGGQFGLLAGGELFGR